ncbi:hypothetical protein F511_18618 [Dorcoceras hygrometricum]|uniref:Uncharacterized protein n=1 Tax=Dorcoceras hygrometricum TaxID=472368 RepID=A0A2Z7ABD7_9LAMI|nr:hypothetical protein F511_18618 [Dorcoceras hygrometricum]
MTSAESVDGSAMMTSAVMSSQSAVSYSITSRWYLKLAIAKRCRLDKWIRQGFAFALRFSRWILQCRWVIQTQATVIQSQALQDQRLVYQLQAQTFKWYRYHQLDNQTQRIAKEKTKLKRRNRRIKPDAVVENTTSSKAVHDKISRRSTEAELTSRWVIQTQATVIQSQALQDQRLVYQLQAQTFKWYRYHQLDNQTQRIAKEKTKLKRRNRRIKPDAVVENTTSSKAVHDKISRRSTEANSC